MKPSHLLVLLFVCSGCNQAPPTPPTPIVDLVVDANRSGLLEPGDPTEDTAAAKNTWDAHHGAVFLANLDDDDGDGKADAEDDVVNGQSDIADLSPIAVRAWPKAPREVTGVLSVDALSLDKVRLFRVNGPADQPGSYVKVEQPQAIALTNADLVAGVSFAIEGLDLVSSTAPDAWTGMVQLTLTVTNAKTKEMFTDAAKLRVAPLILQFNTAKTDAVFFTNAGADTQTLSDGMMLAQLDAPITALDLQGLGLEVDVWAQDFFDVGWTSKPGPNGTEVGMRIAIRSAQPDRTAGDVTTKHFLGPDFGAVFKYGNIAAASDSSYSMNSFGDWDVIPPYTKGADEYPLGRNYWGATGVAATSPDATFQDFYRAQRVQPEINVDTSWLLVGHVDEFSSWVKTNTPRGWGMLAGSPKLARDMLLGMQMAGHGAVKMFDGKTAYDNNGNASPAGIAIDDVLANADLMAESQAAQTHIDDAVMKLETEIGLDPTEVTQMPFLIEKVYGAGLAYQPGTVNLLFVDGKVVIPDPFGPIIDGVDPFKEDLKKRLGDLGLDVHFADDWDTFHEGEGEVHCGTNVARNLQLAWWGTGR